MFTKKSNLVKINLGETMDLIKEEWTLNDIGKFEQYLETFKQIEDKIKRTSSILCTGYRVLAIPTLTLKKISKEILKGNFQSFLNLKIYSTYESIAISGFIISNIKDFELLKSYLSEYSKKADCWALCDLFSFNVKGKENSFLNLSKRLIYSDLPFERRIGYRILFRFIDTNLPFIFDAVNGSFNEKEYYVNMIIAWLLCECFIKQKKETTDFILKNRLNDFVKNKFIQKCRESYRVSEQNKEFLLSLKKQSQ